MLTELPLEPVTWDIVISQGATYRQEYGLPFNASNAEVYAQVYNKSGTVELLRFTTSWIERALLLTDGTYQARFTLNATADETAQVTQNGIWDLYVVDQNGNTAYFLEGKATLNKNYSKEV